MIVVEDIEANEIHRFVVVDASLQLGIVRVGKDIRTFDPDRAFSFFSMVENQLNDFASLYPGAFRYLPRRAYDYLRKPRLLSEFYHSSTASLESTWIVDYLVTKPLIKLGETALPTLQQEANEKSIHQWSTAPPHSPRLYHLQDMRGGRRSELGWGCVLTARDLPSALKGPNRTDLLNYLKTSKPIFIELGPSDELDPLLEWLVLLKQAGLKTPNLVLGTRSHKDWGKNLTRLLDVPGSKVLTSGATIASLSTLVRHMRKNQSDPNWSKRIMFASAYPETQFGDSVSEIFSYLLSRNLAAEPVEIQRILGGNLLSIFTPRPDFLQYSESKTSVVAEENLGKTSMNELARILQLLDARKMLGIVSLDHMFENDGGNIHLDSCVLTLKEPNSPKAVSLALLLEKNGSVMFSGWKRAFSESLKSRDGILLSTLVRANAKLEGPIYGSPAHLTRFDQALLSCILVDRPKEILSALHYGVEIAKSDSGIFFMCDKDMKALEVKDGDFILALDVNIGQWCAGIAKHHLRCSERSIVVSEVDASLFGFQNSSVVNLVKYEGEILDIERAVLSFSSSQTTSNAELASFVHLHENRIRESVKDVLIGSDTRLNFGNQENMVIMGIKHSQPQLHPGQVGRFGNALLDFKPRQSFDDFNIILCISRAVDMKKKDVTLKTLQAVKTQLEPLVEIVPELKAFLDGVHRTASRSQIAILIALLIVNTLRHNQTEGKIALVMFNEAPEKFSIQKGKEIQPFVEFYEDLQSEEVLISVIYSILDSIDEVEGFENMAGAYRSVAEYLEDFGLDRPTLALVMSSDVGTYDEEHRSFLQAISKHDRYRLDILTLGRNDKGASSLRLLKGLNANVVPIETFSAYNFNGYFLDVLDQLIHRTTEHQS